MTNNEWSNICLIVNALIWVFTFVIYQYKTRYFGVGSGILLLYTIISILAIDLYYSEDAVMFNDLYLFPFIYLFSMILLASSPILTMGEKHIKQIESPNMRLFNIVCIGLIVFSFVGLPETITAIRENLIFILLDSDSGKDLYNEWAGTNTSKSNSAFNIISILSNASTFTALPFFIFYTIQNTTKKHKFISIGLAISALISPLYAILSGSRFSLAIFIFNMIFSLIFVRNLLSKKSRKKLIKGITVLCTIFFVLFMAVTFSRANGDAARAFQSIERYGAEAPLLFNNYCLDAGGTRQGDYTAVAFKYIAGMHPAMYYAGRLNKYAHMKIDESRFYTFVGDFTLDYGPVWAVVILLATALFFKRCLIVKDGTMTFHQFLMFYLLMVGCLGYFQFPLGRETGNIRMILILFFALLFKVVYDFDRRKNKLHEKNLHSFGDI